MKTFKTILLPLFLFTTLLAACGGGGGGGSSAPTASDNSVLLGGAIQGKALSLSGTVSTLAGVKVGADGVGALAQFGQPHGVVLIGTSLYVADTINGNIRKVDTATGAVSTVAGVAGDRRHVDGSGAEARFTYPWALATDGTNLYVSDYSEHTIRKLVLSTREVSTLAGTVNAAGNADGIASAASFSYPLGLATDGTYLYVADTGNRKIRRITIATGEVSTLAGGVSSNSAVDGIGAAAVFRLPSGLVLDGANLYVADAYSIRRVVVATAEVSTLAGSGVRGSADGTGQSASFNSVSALATDGTNLYAADAFNDTVRKIVIATGAVTTIAGTAGEAGSVDGIGAAARLNTPAGVATDGTSLYIADSQNGTIRKLVLATGEVSTLAGAPRITELRVSQVTTDGTNLYATDYYTVKKIVIATGAISTLAGVAGSEGHVDGVGAAARFEGLLGITTDGVNLFVSDGNTIRKIVIATGVVSTLAGDPLQEGSADGVGSAARFDSPYGITTDGKNLYVADLDNYTIRKIVIASGAVTTLAGAPGVLSGPVDGIGAAARFSSVSGITTDGANLYVTEVGAVRKIVIATGAVSTLAGTNGGGTSADGVGAAARFGYLQGLTTDGTNLYVADFGANTIRKVVIATGAVTTLAGQVNIAGSADGTGTAASFNSPSDITTDGKSLYVAEPDNNVVRKIQ